MERLVSPFVRLWEWVAEIGGFPGQIFFVVATLMLTIGGLTWYGNRR
jgi:hypothetical protein